MHHHSGALTWRLCTSSWQPASQAHKTEEEAEQKEDQLVKTLRNSLEPTKALLLKEKDLSCQLGQRLLEKAEKTQQLYEGLLEYMDFRIKAMEMTAAAEVQKLRAQLEVATLQARLQEQMLQVIEGADTKRLPRLHLDVTSTWRPRSMLQVLHVVLLLAPELRCTFLSTGFRHQASATQSDKTSSTRFLPGAEDLGLHVYSMLVEQVFNSQGNADWHSCSRAVPP